MERTIRTAVVGIGNMGTAHASCLMRRDVPGMELAAVADIRESRRAYAKEAFPGIAVLETLDQVLEEVRPEAVIIAVPHPKHVILAEKVLKAGCHLLLEKPEDISVSRALELNAIAEKTDKVFSMMFNQRTNPLFQKARELVQSGALGALKRSTWIITNWYRTESYYRSGDWRATWKGEGGGVLLNQAPHNLDLWQWIVGLPSEVTAFTSVGKYHDIEVEDEAQIFTRYADGSVGVFLTTTGEYPGTNRLEIQGTQGKLVLEERTLKYWKVDGDETEYRLHAPETEPKPPVVYEEVRYPKGEDGHVLILRNFAASILNGEPLIAPGPEGVRELSISNAAYLSAWKGSVPVKLPLSEEDRAEFDRLLEERKKTSRYEEKESADAKGKGADEYLSRWSVQW